ncbi:MAG: hypothetical protein AAF499_03225 [Pseudomonadota bacterium]
MSESPLVGFISPPAWFDPAVAEFPRVVEEAVRTQQAPLLLPDFDYRLDSIASVHAKLALCARCLQAIGCNVVAQVGSPFAWAGVVSEAEARARCAALADATGLPTVMTSLAIVDALRAHGAQRVAVNCSYYERDWRDGFATFLAMCGFEVMHASTLEDQGLVTPPMSMAETGWAMKADLTCASTHTVATVAPECDAIVVTGAGTRTLALLVDLEAETGRPIVAADTALYWAAARAIGLSLKPVLASLARLA